MKMEALADGQSEYSVLVRCGRLFSENGVERATPCNRIHES